MCTSPLFLLLVVWALVCLVSAAVVDSDDQPHLDDNPCLGEYDWSSADPSALAALAVENNRTQPCPGPSSLSVDSTSRGTLLVQRNRPRGGTQTTSLDMRPTPAPTGDPSPGTTVHINDEGDFALLLPGRQGEFVSDAEADGVSFCVPASQESHCQGRFMQDGFIVAAAVRKADDGSWVQVTGCIDPSRSTLDPADAGGQLDVRFPNGAQCTFGGYGASFIELVEPALNRFCLRCCASPDDQVNCNSHRDRLGCEVAVPGLYDFPAIGVSCV